MSSHQGDSSLLPLPILAEASPGTSAAAAAPLTLPRHSVVRLDGVWAEGLRLEPAFELLATELTDGLANAPEDLFEDLEVQDTSAPLPQVHKLHVSKVTACVADAVFFLNRRVI